MLLLLLFFFSDRKMLTNFEYLANELIHEIFDYLLPGEILCSFIDLNRRFNRLIAQRLFSLDLSRCSKDEFEQFQRRIPLEQIEELKISHQWTINILPRLCFSSMTNLHRLIFSHVNSNELRQLFESNDFFFLERQLTTLKIRSSSLNGNDRDRIFLLKIIFGRMTKLRSCQFPLIDVHDFDDLTTNFTIEQMILDYSTIHCLDRLFDYLRSVEILTVRLFTDLQNFSPNTNRSSTHSNIRSLQISTRHPLSFSHVENLFRHCFDRLEKLTFFFKTDAISQSSWDYFNEKRWENLLRRFDSLKDFRCSIEFPIDFLRDDEVMKKFNSNEFFRRHRWNFSLQNFTYAFNHTLHLHSDPYPQRRLDIIPMKLVDDEKRERNFSQLRDLHLLIDRIPHVAHCHLSPISFENLSSLTLIGNQIGLEHFRVSSLDSIVRFDRLRSLTIQFDNISKQFLQQIIERSTKLISFNLSTYQSWTKLFQLTTLMRKSSIRSLIVHEALNDFHSYERLAQLFHHFQIISFQVSSVDDCYRLLTILFIGHQMNINSNLRSLTIKCDFDQPDHIAHWLRTNIQRKFSYKFD